MPEALLRVQGIELWGYHGCERCEEEEGARFLLSIEAAYDEPKDGLSDNFAGRPDYALLAERAVAVFNERRWKLVEPLATVIAETLLTEFPELNHVTISIRKLAPVIPLKLEYAEILVTRSRHR